MNDYSLYIMIAYISAFTCILILACFSYIDFFISRRKIRDMENKSE
jgi:hypothetical protein